MSVETLPGVPGALTFRDRIAAIITKLLITLASLGSRHTGGDNAPPTINVRLPGRAASKSMFRSSIPMLYH